MPSSGSGGASGHSGDSNPTEAIYSCRLSTRHLCARSLSVPDVPSNSSWLSLYLVTYDMSMCSARFSREAQEILQVDEGTLSRNRRRIAQLKDALLDSGQISRQRKPYKNGPSCRIHPRLALGLSL